MKYKPLTLLILSLALLGLTSLSAQETPQPTDSLTQYGLESGKSYSAEVVAQLLDAAVAEGQAATIRAFNAGYKAGALDYGPSSAYWEATASVWNAEAKKTATGPTWGTVALAGAGGLAVGFGAGVLAAAAIFGAIR